MAAAAALASVLSLTLATGAAAVAELVMGAEMDYRGLMTGRKRPYPRENAGKSEVGEPSLDPDPVGASIWELSSDWGTASSTARHLPGYKTEAKATGLGALAVCHMSLPIN